MSELARDIGALQLRIYELEDEVERLRAGQPTAEIIRLPFINPMGYRTGLMPALRAALADGAWRTTEEIYALLPLEIRAKHRLYSLRNNLAVTCSKGLMERDLTTWPRKYRLVRPPTP